MAPRTTVHLSEDDWCLVAEAPAEFVLTNCTHRHGAAEQAWSLFELVADAVGRHPKRTVWEDRGQLPSSAMTKETSPERTVQDLVEEIVKAGLATRDDLEGCSEEDLAALEAEFDVTLPDLYKQVMRRVGKDSGLYGSAMTFITYPAVAKHNRGLRRAMERRDDRHITESYFAFSFAESHYMVFDTDDPKVRVYRYSGGEPVQLYESLEQALFDAIEHDVEVVESNSHFEFRTEAG